MQEEEEACGGAATGKTVDGRHSGRRTLGSAPDMTVGEEGGREEVARAGLKEEDAAEALLPFDAPGGAEETPEATPKEEGVADEGVVVVVGCQQQQAPFAYSQENFHIADGNLYSILTPFQSKATTASTARRTSAPGGHQQDTNTKGQPPAAAPPSAPRSRGRRRAKWKLKFHHQALPPEYLDHYEAAMAQEARAAAAAAAAATTGPTAGPAASTSTPPPPLIRIDKGAETPGPSKGPTSTPRPSTAKGAGRRVPNFIQDLQLKDVQQPVKVKQFKLEPIEGPGPHSEESTPTPSPRLVVKAFATGETTVSSSVQSPVDQNSQPLEEKRTSVIMASGGGGCRSSDGIHVGSPLRDLPYMGEMTLDSKPRRGRKPKKADICHLIYKNYGTILSPASPRCSAEAVVASPAPSSPSSSASSLSPSSPSSGGGNCGAYKNFTATESLLAKRLTQAHVSKRCSTDIGSEQDEPLNLCIRDLRRINVSGPFLPVMKTEPAEMDGRTPESGGAGVLEKGLELVVPPAPGDDSGASAPAAMSVVNAAFSGMAQPVAGNYIYWPNAGVFVHPMALQSHLLYCQKMGAAAVAAAATAAPNAPPAPAEKPKHQRAGEHRQSIAPQPLPIVSLTIPGKPPQEFTQEHASSPATPFGRTVALRPVELGRVPPTPPVVLPEEVPASPTPVGRKRAVHATSLATKRKRSAIFIPPTAENPTEVSICKFKFTGGAKPSLEEKKMLSVDAGGNFRYYSGTGDKSMRGYEFFPREQTLQQQYMGSNIGSLISGKPPTPSSPCSSSSTPSGIASSSPSSHHFPCDHTPSPLHSHDVTAVQGEPPPMRPTSAKAGGSPSCSLAFHRHSGDSFPLGAEGSSVALGGESSGQQPSPDGRKGSASQGPTAAAASSGPRRKRRTRKSLVREKLEQTFREKGFLIQTQQLESAEGATYCKFRQLRKFTRYLFRSWKDYLPGNIKEISSSVTGGGSVSSGQEGSEATGVATPVDAVPGSCPPHE